MKQLPVTYVSMGLRRYGEHPIRAAARGDWEVQCIFRGLAQPSPARSGFPDSGARLYVFVPQSEHGWSAPARDTSEVLVFHMSPQAKGWKGRSLPAPVACRPVNDLEVLRLRTLHDWLFPHFLHPHRSSVDVLESGCILLADLVDALFQPFPVVSKDGQRLHASRRVDEACRCYRENMLQNPTVDQIAGSIGTSASQLRRVFAAAGRPPPAKVFRSMQMDYAHRLLVGTRLSVEQIAEELGFSSLSTFSRAFTGHGGQTPRQIRGSKTRDVTIN